ncbi:MAG: hypothetical protein LQ338_008207 [Usnochroma carphineum]|nr:MAG: hypothetical protein LQ338_008207 [Usnochroma carphineum]
MSRTLRHFFGIFFYFFVLVSWLPVATALPRNIWHVSIFKGPAPARERGPPISASSLRDPAYLPAQIGGIFAAYILSLVVIGTALLFVGRRLRRAAQASPRTLAMEMMRPVQTEVRTAFDPSPVSPAPALKDPYGPSPSSTLDMKSNWPSPDKSRTSVRWPSVKGYGHRPSLQSSVVTFDESVIEEDKNKNQHEMERLYAAVMEHDELKSTGSLPPKETYQPQHPPELQHLRTSNLLSQPASPPPRGDTKSPARTLTISPKKSIRPSPIMVHSRNSSRSSFGSLSKKRGVRNLPISPPMGSPDVVPEHLGHYAETEPLSPRLYNPGPPPPTPPAREAQAQKYQQQHLDTSRLSPRQGSFREALRTPRTSIPTFPTVPEKTELTQPPGCDSAIQQPTPPKPKKTPVPLSLKTQTSAGATGTLPLRSAPLPFRNLNNSRAHGDRPPSMIKATVLERKVPDHRLGTPRTGVPATPYSPYMPFTPLTPMTPSRLVTREERKKKGREEGRRVATIDDKVEEESEIWGDAY